MAYSELIPLPAIGTLSDDGTQLTIIDNTVYAPDGQGTPTFPSYADTQRWIVYRKNPWEEDTILYYPATQVGGNPPWEFTIPVEDGNLYQIFLLIVAEALDWEDFFDYGPVADIVQFAIDDYAAGTLAVIDGQAVVNCVNQSRRAAINNLVKNGCCSAMFYQKNAQLQGLVSTMGLYPTYSMLSDLETELYVEGGLQLDTLERVCDQSPCCDNC